MELRGSLDVYAPGKHSVPVFPQGIGLGACFACLDLGFLRKESTNNRPLLRFFEPVQTTQNAS
jgi:hypothetical protein